MYFELNNDGLKLFKSNPKEYILNIRNLCWINDIPVCYEETDNYIRLSLLEPTYFQGCMIEYNNNNKLPFILDDKEFKVSRDCPSIEEGFIRFWNMQRIIHKGYDRTEILNAEPFKENFDNFILKFDEWRIKDEERYWNSIDFSSSLIRAKTKSRIINSLENIDEVANDEQKEIVNSIPSYIYNNWKSGTLSSYDNLETLKNCFKDLLDMI